MKTEKILFIAHRIPYPPDKGDKIRSYHMLRYLSERHRVAVACMIDDADDLVHIDALKSEVDNLYYTVRSPLVMKLKAIQALFTGEPFTKPCFYSQSLQKEIDNYLDKKDIQAVVCFCAAAANYVFQSRHYPELRQKTLLADLVDVDSRKWLQYAEQKNGLMRWLFQREAKLLRSYEQQVADSFDRTFLVSEEEKSVMAEDGSVAKVEALSNGVDLDFFSPVSGRQNEFSTDNHKLVFSGAMDYWPNIEGAVWFAREVFPTVRKAVPDAVFCIAGRNPDKAVAELSKQPGIEVTGTVPDIRNYLARAALCVAPLQIARGIQNKVLEGMAMQKAVVASPGAAVGLKAAHNKEFVVAESAAAMSEAVIRLLKDENRRNQIGAAARRYVERAHSWRAHLSRLDEMVSTDKQSAMH